MAKKQKLMSDQIRAAVKASGMSRYRIAKEIGIAESGMSRFMSGAGLGMDVLDRLAALLGLRIVADDDGDTKAKR
jgi:transcriptional regulator with XRE-family HTH domain